MRLYKRGRVYWIAYYDASAKQHKRVSSKLTDRNAAFSLGCKLERHGADPDGAAAAEATLSDALDAVIAEYKRLATEGEKSPQTVEFYRKRASQVLRMVSVGKLPALLAELRAKHVDDMIDFRRDEGTKRHTIQKDLIVLRLALKMAKRKGRWRGDLDEVLPHRFGSGYEPVERWLTPVELWGLLAELRSDRAAWVAFAIATGANYSEAAKAVHRDVKPGNIHLRGTKRETRDRQVPLVFAWQGALLAGALSALPREGPLFLRPWSASNMARDLAKASRAAGIAPCTSNDLRRTFGTWMRASGASLELLAPAMGHATTRMVEQVYARLDVTQLTALLKASAADVQEPLASQPNGETVPEVYADSTEPTETPDESGEE